VIMDGEPIRSCLCLAVQANGTSIETIEGVGGDTPENLSVVQKAFREHHALQCGFCTPGIVVAATALLRKDPDPEDSDLNNLMSGHLCRCTGYANIMMALRSAAQTKEG
jgi:aerobic carbon-monoxide dehydrogenase small subunit